MDKLLDQLNDKVLLAESNDKKNIDKRIDSIKDYTENNYLPVLFITPSSKCNLKCSFCGMHSNLISNNNFKKMHMSMDLFNEIIVKSKSIRKFKEFIFAGMGEPLLNKNIVEMVKITKNAKITNKIILVTNGVFLTSDKFKKLVEAGINTFKISLDVISSKKFFEIKGVDVGEDVVKNLENCIKLINENKLNIDFTIICSSTTSDELDLTNESKRIVDHFMPLIQDSSNIKIHFRKIFNWVDSINETSNSNKNKYERPFPCEQPFYLLSIHSDGEISMCCPDVKKQLVLANISKIKSLKEVITSKRLKELRKNLQLLNFNEISACKHCYTFSLVNNSLLTRRNELLSILDKNI
jgi:radical SAM protein with 4Fe4S-binding SPASM domain